MSKLKFQVELDVKQYGVIGAIRKAFNATHVENYCGMPWDKVPFRCDWLAWPASIGIGAPDFVVTIDGSPVCFQVI